MQTPRYALGSFSKAISERAREWNYFTPHYLQGHASMYSRRMAVIFVASCQSTEKLSQQGGMQEKAAAKAKAVDAYNEAHRAKPLMEQHADTSKKVAISSHAFILPVRRSQTEVLTQSCHEMCQS